MPKQISNATVKTVSSVLPNKRSVLGFILKRKKVFIGLVLILILLFGTARFVSSRNNKTKDAVKTLTVKVDKSLDFTALNTQGKSVSNKIKLKIADVEKTNQVLVKDQSYTAKNNKQFLIVNLELKNEASIPLNILPGDLVRLTIDGDEENKFAPDLHNNLVLVSAISTKLDRIGFVIPEEAKKFKILIGELEGKKETVSIDFRY